MNKRWKLSMRAATLTVSLGTTVGVSAYPIDPAVAKITESQARATSLAAEPSASVETSELEREGGRLVWSFDLRLPHTRDVAEVQVDATTGKIVSHKRESPADQAKESLADRKQPQRAR